MEEFIQGLFQFNDGGCRSWYLLNICALLLFLLIYWLSRTEEIFLIGVFAYLVILPWSLAMFFGLNRRKINLPIDWALCSALMEAAYLALFFYFSSRRSQKRSKL